MLSPDTFKSATLPRSMLSMHKTHCALMHLSMVTATPPPPGHMEEDEIQAIFCHFEVHKFMPTGFSNQMKKWCSHRPMDDEAGLPELVH